MLKATGSTRTAPPAASSKCGGSSEWMSRAYRSARRGLHAPQISLSRSTARATIWPEWIVLRREADIPDMLTTVPHAWILDTVERRVITVSRADRENNEP